jgi:23S rRNA pseudouridine955/2504/2580 synthase
MPNTSAASDQVRQFTVSTEDDGIRLDRWFKRNLPDASFNLVSRWSRTGQLRLDGKRAGPGDRVEAGQIIRVPPADPAAEAKPAKPQRRTLSADEAAYVNEMVIHRDSAASSSTSRRASRPRAAPRRMSIWTACSKG